MLYNKSKPGFKMEEERKNKVKNKKQLDKKHRSFLSRDDDIFFEKQKKKNFRLKKQNLNSKYVEDWENYDENM